ncbi:HotDog domain-containing protein [Bisporella sp. PMI_857]|nr:HotDog domain-containing protein [Bisporella sp. PMI_857]
MRPQTLSFVLQRAFYANQPFKYIATRHLSGPALQSSLREKLTSQAPNRIYDYLSPTPSHLLNIALSDFLPESCQPDLFNPYDLELPRQSLTHEQERRNLILPQGHHLVYFPPQLPSSSLLPDGTDILHSPGPPFSRRMWAGGSLVFETGLGKQLFINNDRLCCTELISDVTVRGKHPDEKVFVSVTREYSKLFDLDASGRKTKLDPLRKLQHEEIGRNLIFSPSVTEERNLVFFRDRDPAFAQESSQKSSKRLLPPHEPDFSVTLTPTPSLLFRFSALTFNAHAIHLDPQYCRDVEGHRNLLVHGPLTLVLMLSVLRSQLRHEQQMVLKFEYRNLAPLYVNEEMRICVRKDGKKKDKYDVWIEGKDGGYAVKGSATTAGIESFTG